MAPEEKKHWRGGPAGRRFLWLQVRRAAGGDGRGAGFHGGWKQ